MTICIESYLSLDLQELICYMPFVPFIFLYVAYIREKRLFNDGFSGRQLSQVPPEVTVHKYLPIIII